MTFKCCHCQTAQLKNKIYEVDGYTIVRCRKCRLMMVHPLPEPASLEQYYAHYAPGDLAEGETKALEMRRLFWTLQRQASGVANRGALLDIGCGYGFFLQSIRDAFATVTGIELSKSEACYARQVLGLEVFDGYLSDMGLCENSFDVVTMWDVIEHLHNPFGYLQEINRILKVGGDLIVSTPNVCSLTARVTGAQWRLWAPPEHLYYFCAATLTDVLRCKGFKVRVITTCGFDWFNVFTRFSNLPYTRRDLLFTSPKRIEFDSQLRQLGIGWVVIRAINVITKRIFRYFPLGDVLYVRATKVNEVQDNAQI